MNTFNTHTYGSLILSLLNFSNVVNNYTLSRNIKKKKNYGWDTKKLFLSEFL